MANKVFSKSKFNINKVLPNEMVIRGADSHLYRIGVSLSEIRTKIKRKWYFSPYLISFFVYFNSIKHLTLQFMDLRGADIHWIIGDVDYFFQSMNAFNISFPICGVLILGLQLINVYNKWKGIKLDLSVFEMMAGFTSPKSIGLEDEGSVVKLIKFTRMELMVVRITKTITTFNTFVILLILPSLRTSPFGPIPTIVLVISWAFFNATWAEYFFPILYYHFAYFTILCYYLHLKLSQINRRLVNKEKNIYKIITEFTDIYREINHYNRNYWSKYLLVIYSTLSSLIAMQICFSLFVETDNPIIRVMMFIYALFNIISLILMIRFSSLIYNDCVLTYRLLNSYVHSVKRITLRNRIKVSYRFIQMIYLCIFLNNTFCII